VIDNKDRTVKKVNGMFNYYTDDKKRAMIMFDYVTGNLNKEQKMNLILENGEYATSEEIEIRKKKFARYINNSNLWRGVISFDNDYLTQNIDIGVLEQKLVKKVIPAFLNKCGFIDKNKMAYQIALHTDTDNLHFHFSFIEKKPNTKLFDDRISYRRKGKLSQRELDFMKNEIVHVIEKEKVFTPLLTKTNEDIEDLKKHFNPKEKNYVLWNKEDLLMESNILELGKLIYDERDNKDSKIKFNSITNDEIKNLTKSIKDNLFKKQLVNEYKAIHNSLDKINQYFNDVKKSNNIKRMSENKLVKTKLDYVDNYVLNAIVNHANYKYRRKISFEDLIREKAMNQYKRNKSRTRFKILQEFLTDGDSAFKSKLEMIRAMSSVSEELEEAKNEFGKLFKNNTNDFEQ